LISFYQLCHHDKTGSLPTTKLLKTLERKLLTRFMWSPRGDYALFTGMDATSGYMEFWSVNDFVLLCSKEHVTATDAEWDPSGRFVLSYISYLRFQSDNAFIVSDFKGVQLCKVNMPKMSWVGWRPRPKSMLTKEQQKAIKKNLKAYSERFEQEDRLAADSSQSSAAAHRANLLSSWAAFKMRTKERADSRRQLRDSITHVNHNKQQQRVEIEEWQEEVIEEKEEKI
jgi:translation initiation factor 3 subunit B